MANMLRKQCSYEFGCCGYCARGGKVRPQKRERHMARAREKRQWKREARAE